MRKRAKHMQRYGGEETDVSKALLMSFGRLHNLNLSEVTEDRKSVTKIRRRIEIAKNASKILRNR